MSANMEMRAIEIEMQAIETELGNIVWGRCGADIIPWDL